uniref:Uncharacterized protein n=1 Tax=Anguilla anguilla TaxID=7936 RepID=A0A0E9UEK2_ANGAN
MNLNFASLCLDTIDKSTADAIKC